MECRDAQFYLRLQRHATDELGPDVTGALNVHLAGCPTCAAGARSAAALDRAVATAMCAVPVPASLRERLITRAAAAQGAILRRKLYRYAAAGAAALVFLALGFGVFSNTRPKLDPERLVQEAEDQVSDPEGATKRWLAARKLPTELPYPFDYTLFAGYGTEDVAGRPVPWVKFRSSVPGDNGFVKVFIVRDDGRFDLKNLQDVQSSRARAQVLRGKENQFGVTYVLVYTGFDLQPFLRNAQNPA
jgi:hypothetical protein